MWHGEIFGLAVDGLDLEGGWLHVIRQLKLVRSRLVFGLPKNDRPRRIPLPVTVAKVQRRHMEEKYPPVTGTLPWEDPTSDELVSVDLVLTSTRRGAINRAVFDRKSWRPALIKAEIVPTRATGVHALRHIYASALLDAGESIKALVEYLGHSDPAFTLRVYTHLMPSSEKRARCAIDDLFTGPDSGPDVLATS